MRPSRDDGGTTRDLDALLARIRACQLCIKRPRGKPLPHAPNPVLRPSTTRWHRPQDAALGMTEMVRNWRRFLAAPQTPRYLPLPHPSWRNNAWVKKNPWFETELLPTLQREVRALL